MSLNVNVYLHGLDELDKVLRKIDAVYTQGEDIMATLDDLVGVVDEVLSQVGRLGPAVDALESKITAALKNAGLTAEQQAKIDDAVGRLKGVVASVATAIADATDGVDEGDVVPTPTPEPAPTPPEQPQ